MLRDLALLLVAAAAVLASGADGGDFLVPERWMHKMLPTLEEDRVAEWLASLAIQGRPPASPAGTPAAGPRTPSPVLGPAADDSDSTIVRGLRAVLASDLDPYLDSLPGYGDAGPVRLPVLPAPLLAV